MEKKIIISVFLFMIFIINNVTVSSNIIVDNADTIWSADLEESLDVYNTVDSRIIVDESKNLYLKTFQEPTEMFNLLSSRIIVDNANSLLKTDLQAPDFAQPPQSEPDSQPEVPVEEDDQDELKKIIEDYAPVLYVCEKADHNCPGPVSQIIDNSRLMQKSITFDTVIVENPNVDDLFVYSADSYYLDEKDNEDKGDNPITYVHFKENINRYFLQYWFFYYYNDGANNHEGDWEMIQISLDSNYQPLKATYSQHEGSLDFNWGEKRNWNYVEKYIDGNGLTNHPVVYVSSGVDEGWLLDDHSNANSHANYFYKGDGPATDYTDNCTYKISFTNDQIKFLPELDDNLQDVQWRDYKWIKFEGRWGECGVLVFDGPPGPVFRTFECDGEMVTMWENPFCYEDGRLYDGDHSHWTDINIGDEGFEYPIIEMSDKTVKVGDSVVIDAYLKDESGNPIAGKNLYFFINKKFVWQWTTENDGRAYYTFRDTSAEGEHEIEAVFKGQNDGYSDYTWCQQSATLTISEAADGQTTTDDTPGFEIILVVFALLVVLVLKRKSKII